MILLSICRTMTWLTKWPVFLEYQVYFSWLKFKVFTILLSYLVFLSTQNIVYIPSHRRNTWRSGKSVFMATKLRHLSYLPQLLNWLWDVYFSVLLVGHSCDVRHGHWVVGKFSKCTLGLYCFVEGMLWTIIWIIIWVQL